ncbi:MAG: hypothetical protein IKK70_06615 [Clostridia bacterium]|nr:hypothetical protein [Clostridia bacterium]
MDINVFLKDAITRVQQDEKYVDFINDVMEQYPDIDACDGDCPYTGCLSAETLKLLLTAERRELGLELAGWALAIFTDSSTVDDEAFRMVMRIRGKHGRSLRMTMPHLPLAFYQMYELSKTEDGGMALDCVLYWMCESNCFTCVDVIELLKASKAKPAMKRFAVDHTKKLVEANEKTAAMEQALGLAE